MNVYKNIVGIALLIMSSVSSSDPISHSASSLQQQLSDISVCNCRIFLIDNYRRAVAETLLNSKAYVKLDSQKLKYLLSEKTIDFRRILAEEILLAKEDSDFRRKKAKEYPSSRSFQSIAEEADARYEYLKTVKLPFYPYLIRGEYYTKSGSYSLVMRDGFLMVHHLSLGNKIVELKKEYMVVFLDSEIVGVNVGAGMAE